MSPMRAAAEKAAGGPSLEAHGGLSLHGQNAARRQAITELLFFSSVGDLYRCQKICSTWKIDVRHRGVHAHVDVRACACACGGAFPCQVRWRALGNAPFAPHPHPHSPWTPVAATTTSAPLCELHG